MKQTLSTLLQLNPLHLPPAPSWWPLAWGWLSLIGTALALLVLVVFLIRRRRIKLAPKKAALRIFTISKDKMSPSDAIELVRQAALCYFPREEIAKLSGREWYAFLDSYTSKTVFTDNAITWQKALYHKESITDPSDLVNDCQEWIQLALPPRKRR